MQNVKLSQTNYMAPIFLIAICISLITFFSTSAYAQPLTCAELAAGLQGNKSNIRTDYGAILIGVVQTAAPRACVPSGTLLGTLQAVFLHWADQHEAQMSTEGWSCAAKAFTSAYPCSQRR